MNKLIIASLFLCAFSAKATLPYETDVKKFLEQNNELAVTFQNEMGLLLQELSNSKNTEQFIKKTIESYCKEGLLFPTANILPDDLKILQRDLGLFMKDKLPDIPNNNENAIIKSWITSFYDEIARDNATLSIDNSFIQDSSYSALQATLFILKQPLLTENRNKAWATKVFAISYLRSFVDMDLRDTFQKRKEIIDAFGIKSHFNLYSENKNK